jgi:3-deoxy-D-manno-octulosonic-acid transferase
LSLFSFFYYSLATLLYIIALPFIVYKSRTSKYKNALPSRFFLRNNAPFDKKGIWFHCCSFGETKALAPIIEKLEDEVNISVITNTGFEEAQKLTNNVRYLPYEIFLPFWIRQQKVLVVMEAELWYLLFLTAFNNGIKTVLINARISDRSVHSYRRFAWFYKRIFDCIDITYAQSPLDKERLENLGAKNVHVAGNIKLSVLPKVTKNYEKPDVFTVTLGSSHENEEALVLDAYNEEIEKLIVVPRHPERFETVHELLSTFARKHNKSYNRFSVNESLDAQIVLVDVMGALNNIYAISDCVILGGAFEKIGGHNPVEPAFFNCAIITGKHYFNQKPLFECINAYTVLENDELKDCLKHVKDIVPSSLKQIGDISPIIKEINEL